MKITFVAPSKLTKHVTGVSTHALALYVGEGKLTGHAAELDKFAHGEISRAIANSNR